MKVIAYTGGHNSPSRIFRVQHYIEPLKRWDITVRECASAAGAYPPIRKWLRPAWALWNVGERGLDTLRSLAYDMVFFQREMLSTFVTWEPLAKRPRVFDVDDAIWIHPRGDYAKRLARLCDHVICGNEFLADEFSRWNPGVSVLPTSVNVRTFCPRPEKSNGERPIVGWMGLGGNLRFLSGIERALAEVLRRHPNAVLRIVSNLPPQLPSLPAHQVEFIPWSADIEARSIQEMTIGIMPLDDTVYSRGKCAYKMLLYMSCGLPVVVSAVGMNLEVLQRGKVGFGATRESEWIDYLNTLLGNPQLREEMGAAGRQVVVENYSVEVLAPKLASILAQIGK